MDLFTYGTLQYDEVWRRVVGRSFPVVAGEVRGFAVYRVVNTDYPGMIARLGATTPGTVYRGIDNASLTRLDLFEGPHYERQAVEVVTADSPALPCQAYVTPAIRSQLLTDEPWTRESFLENDGLRRFLAKYVGFAGDV